MQRNINNDESFCGGSGISSDFLTSEINLNFNDGSFCDNNIGQSTSQPVNDDIDPFIADEDDDQEESDVFDRELFLVELRKYRCLWDINAETYKNRGTKSNAWQCLASIFNKNGEFFTSSYSGVTNKWGWLV